MGLEPDECLYAIALGKTWSDLIAVLPDPIHQIVGHPDVKRAVRFVCEDVNKESHTWGRKRIDGGCNRPFVRKLRIPAQAGIQGFMYETAIGGPGPPLSRG